MEEIKLLCCSYCGTVPSFTQINLKAFHTDKRYILVCEKCGAFLCDKKTQKEAINFYKELGTKTPAPLVALDIAWPPAINQGTIVAGLNNGRECDAYIEGFNRALRQCKETVARSTPPLTLPSRERIEFIIEGPILDICNFCMNLEHLPTEENTLEGKSMIKNLSQSILDELKKINQREG